MNTLNIREYIRVHIRVYIYALHTYMYIQELVMYLYIRIVPIHRGQKAWSAQISVSSNDHRIIHFWYKSTTSECAIYRDSKSKCISRCSVLWKFCMMGLHTATQIQEGLCRIFYTLLEGVPLSYLQYSHRTVLIVISINFRYFQYVEISSKSSRY